MNILLCPHCEIGDKQSRYGFSRGIQRYRCGYCNLVYVDGDARGYDAATRARVLALLGQGHSIREVARIVEVSTSTVLRWKKWGLSQSEWPALPVPLPDSRPEVPPLVRRPQGAPASVTLPAPFAVPAAKMSSEQAMAMLEKGGIVSAADLMRD